MTSHRKFISLFCVPVLIVSTLEAETLTLSKKFVQDNKNRATIDLKLEVDAHLKSPHKIGTGGDDGDVHMAGRSNDVRLPMVAEIINAGIDVKPMKDSVNLMNATDEGGIVDASGVWRIWFEHPSKGNQIQGRKVAVPANSNPDHVFEVHPITKFGGNDIADLSFKPILGNSNCSYHAYAADRAFGEYEKQKATISVSGTSVSITAKKVGFNYAEFLIDPVGKSKAGPAAGNGIFVLADVFDASDEETHVTSSPRRMVFVKGTAPAQALDDLENKKRSGPLHVLGIPRVNLAEVAQVSGESVDMPLPYEMIIVAVLPDDEVKFCSTK